MPFSFNIRVLGLEPSTSILPFAILLQDYSYEVRIPRALGNVRLTLVDAPGWMRIENRTIRGNPKSLGVANFGLILEN